MEIVTRDSERERYARVGIYSDPKCGKTRLITSLPWGKEWGEKAIYVAWDPGADDIERSPVLLHNRERLITVRPSYPKKLDPHTEAYAIASRKWREEFPEARTIVWDTMTSTARDLLAQYADSGVFSDSKHISVGQGEAYIAQPMQGDYMVAQGSVMRIIDFLFRQPMNVIVAFHMESTEPEGMGTIGPASVGRGAIRPIASRFDNLFRVEVRDHVMPGSNPPVSVPKYVLHTQRKGKYMGGIRTPHGKNPCPEIIMQEDPVNAWVEFGKLTEGAR